MRVDVFMPGMRPGALVWDLYQDLCRAIRAEEKGKGALTATEIFRQVEDATATVRRTMTQKYQIEF